MATYSSKSSRVTTLDGPVAPGASQGDHIGLLFDLDQNKMEFFHNRISIGSKSFPRSGTFPPFLFFPSVFLFLFTYMLCSAFGGSCDLWPHC